jgi:hypothetical protein
MTENDMTSLLLQLADRGVTGIRVHYSGGGDSGCIEEITYTTETLSTDEEEVFETIDELSSWNDPSVGDLRALDSGLASDLDDFANDKILGNLEDWWNNDGGYGVMSIMVPSGKYRISNNIYITRTEEYTHEGTLINQTLK